MAFWIVKTEPKTYSFDDLERESVTPWDGVRNYQARNNLRNMALGDLVMVYHSVGPKELVGIAEVVGEPKSDDTASDGDWVAVDIKFVSRLNNPVGLATIKSDERLSDLSLVKQSRLSVCPVSPEHWRVLLDLAG